MEITQSEEQQSRDQGVQQYLTFMIGGEEYAVGLLKVREIVEYEPVTRIPRMPAWVRGVMNLRGSVVPVVDLAIKFGQTSSEIGKLTCVVIVEVELDGEATVMGVITDAVSLLGMARSGKKFCLLLDTDAVLSANELMALTTSMETSPGEIETSSRYAEPEIR